MTEIHWPELLIGAVVGGVLGVILDRHYGRYERRRSATQIQKKFGFLGRTYQVLRDGITVTGGSIELKQGRNVLDYRLQSGPHNPVDRSYGQRMAQTLSSFFRTS